MRFSLIDPGDWRWTSFLERSEHDVYHRPEYATLLGEERRMEPCACFGESEDGAFLMPLLTAPLPAGLNLSSGLRDARSPDGYPGPLCTGGQSLLSAVRSELAAFLRSEHIVTCFVRFHPALRSCEGHLAEEDDIVTRGETIALHLDQPYESIRAGMRSGHRSEIRQAIAKGFEVVYDRWDDLPRFVAWYRQLMDRVDAAPVYRFSDRYFEGLKRLLGEFVHLITVVDGKGVPAGGALFTRTGGLMQYHLAATDPAFAQEAVQKLVVDGLIRWGIEKGAQVLHLGGGVGARDDSLLDFKAGFGGSRLDYRTWEIVADPEMSELAVAALIVQRDGARLDEGFFPPYRAPVT